MQTKLISALLCGLLLSCSEPTEMQKKAQQAAEQAAEQVAEAAKQAAQPVTKIATAPDGTVLWKVRDTTTGGTSYVYFSSGGTTVREGKNGIRVVPTSACSCESDEDEGNDQE